MPLDASAVRCAAYEIEKYILGGRIEKIYQPEKDEIVLVIKNCGKNIRLAISAGAANPRIYITDTAKENPKEPPMFCMLMRKHILSGKILGVKSIDFERVVDIEIESRSEMGDMVRKHLMCEIMGKNSNIILTDEDMKIVDAVKHVDLTVSRVRNVFPKLKYTLPPDGGRANPLEMTGEDFYRVLENCAQGRKIDKAMTEHIAGISPLMAREAAYRGIGKADVTPGEMTCEEKRRVADVLEEMFEKVKNYVFDIFIITKKGDIKPFDFAVYEITQYGEDYDCRKMPDICGALEMFYSKRDAAERMRMRSAALMKNVVSQLERMRKKTVILQDTLKECENKEDYRIAGDIITANLYRMNMGDESLTAENYYDEDCKEITIKLDRAKSPSKNAQVYYKKYQKAKTAEVEAKKQLEKTFEDIEYLESVVNEIEFARLPSELDEIKSELMDAGVIKNASAGKKAAKKSKMSAPEEYFYKGYTIFAGKNNVQNDYLTLKVGRSNDIWLHTKNIPGSHVLIKSKGEDIPKDVIEAAAVIAATKSKGAKNGKTDVDYCPVSHVKKPGGAKAGMVIYENYNTATVSPSEEFCMETAVIKN